MYYPCSENKGADQLRGYREADLRLCFRIGKYPVFSRCGSNVIISCICQNKGTDQLCKNCEADQRLCFHCTDSCVSRNSPNGTIG